jgi:hypothetical protein
MHACIHTYCIRLLGGIRVFASATISPAMAALSRSRFSIASLIGRLPSLAPGQNLSSLPLFQYFSAEINAFWFAFGTKIDAREFGIRDGIIPKVESGHILGKLADFISCFGFKAPSCRLSYPHHDEGTNAYLMK